MLKKDTHAFTIIDLKIFREPLKIDYKLFRPFARLRARLRSRLSVKASVVVPGHISIIKDHCINIQNEVDHNKVNNQKYINTLAKLFYTGNSFETLGRF